MAPLAYPALRPLHDPCLASDPVMAVKADARTRGICIEREPTLIRNLIRRFPYVYLCCWSLELEYDASCTFQTYHCRAVVGYYAGDQLSVGVGITQDMLNMVSL